MHCPECKANVVEQAVFCHKCGQRLNSSEQNPAETESFTPEPPEPPAGEPEKPPAEKLADAAAQQENAEEPEKDLWQGSYSIKAMIGGWLLSGLISLAVLLIWIKWVPGRFWFWMLLLMILPWAYHFVLAYWRRWNVSYSLTNQRFIHETGILRRVTDRIEVIDMDDITFEQGLLERLVGVGTIHVSSSDRTHPELLLYGIENVKEVAGQLDDARRAERRRRGLHIESI